MSALTRTEDPAHETAPPSLDLQEQVQQIQQIPNETPNRKPKAPSVRRACIACHTGKTRCSEVLPCQSCLKRGLGATCSYPDPTGDSADHSQAQHLHTPGSTPHASDGDTKKHLMFSFQLKAPPVQATFAANPQQLFSVQQPQQQQSSTTASPHPNTTTTTTTIPPNPTTTTTTTTPSANISQQHYYDYNGAFTGASSSTFRPAKRQRNLTDEEAAAITRNFSRGDFYVGTSAPVRIDPRLPVRLTLGEGDHVHFTVGESLL